MRAADKPGDYRIRPRPDGSFRVSGMKRDGSRIKWQSFPTKSEAEMYVALNFQDVQTDEWGLPIQSPSDMKMSTEATQQTNATLGFGSPQPKVVTEKDKDKQREDAMSLSELVGTAWAAGTVFVGRKLSENAGKDPVNPDPKQVQKLGSSAAKTIQGWFGDKEIKPWVMTVLLTLGILITMLIQARPKAAKEKTPDLKSVP